MHSADIWKWPFSLERTGSFVEVPVDTIRTVVRGDPLKVEDITEIIDRRVVEAARLIRQIARESWTFAKKE
jgi:hypothetical protein